MAPTETGRPKVGSASPLPHTPLVGVPGLGPAGEAQGGPGLSLILHPVRPLRGSSCGPLFLLHLRQLRTLCMHSRDIPASWGCGSYLVTPAYDVLGSSGYSRTPASHPLHHLVCQYCPCSAVKSVLSWPQVAQGLLLRSHGGPCHPHLAGLNVQPAWPLGLLEEQALVISACQGQWGAPGHNEDRDGEGRPPSRWTSLQPA